MSCAKMSPKASRSCGDRNVELNAKKVAVEWNALVSFQDIYIYIYIYYIYIISGTEGIIPRSQNKQTANLNNII